MTERAGGRFLVVCTANQCRSPLGAAILGAAIEALDLGITVDSAGVNARPGSPATAPTVEAAATLGLDLRDHRSQAVTEELIRDSDLIVTMERRQVQEVVLADLAAFARTFTFKELVRRGTDVGARDPGEPFAGWLARVHSGRRPTDLLGASPDDEVVDPTGNALADHRSTAAELESLSAALLELIWPLDERAAAP